jgi:hypothetical protein
MIPFINNSFDTKVISKSVRHSLKKSAELDDKKSWHGNWFMDIKRSPNTFYLTQELPLIQSPVNTIS